MEKNFDPWDEEERKKKLADEHKGTKWEGNILRKYSEPGTLLEPHECSQGWDPVIGWYTIA